MTFLEYVFLFLILVLYGVVAATFIVFVLDSAFYGHDLPTSRRAAKALAAAIKRYSPRAKNFYDLGCAHGDLCLRLKKDLPDVAICGIDKGAIRIFFARVKSKILGRKVSFKKRDIFQSDLSDADVIYTYLWYSLMPVLEKKLQNELKQGAVVITNTSHFQDWQAVEKIITYPKVSKLPDFETLFVYVKKQTSF